jgi:transglutaminase-like putative cysteine protease
MRPLWQIPRDCLFWLLVSVVISIGLHLEHLPPWVALSGIIAALWQIQLYRERWRQPGRLLKWSLAVACAGGLFLHYGRMSGLEPMVGLLFTGYALKLLEIHNRRDALVLLYLSYLIIILQSLFSNTIVSSLLVLAALLPVTGALVAMHRGTENNRPTKALRMALAMTLQAIPLMLVMFIVMPRIGSLWAVPQQNSATTGVSDSMSPGDMTKLGRSGKIAFRVEFDGPIPAQSQLYWRGLVFSGFDGRRWDQQGPWGYNDGQFLQWSDEALEEWDKVIVRRGKPLSYRITMEATNSPWLFALSTPVSQSPTVALSRDFRLVNREPVISKLQYSVSSWLDNQLEAEKLPGWRRQLELAIPSGYNPKTIEVAQQWRQQTPDTVALINRLLALYNQEFIYTLRPPALGKHTVDEFLWGTKKGFCEFYASSFVFFMRAAGVPARVVVGYQGGERHPTENYLLVHQYDAHAWAEVWIQGRGWLRVDPTAAVAPERIEMSFADLFSEQEDFLAESPFSLERMRHINWLNTLRLKLDSLDYAWAKWVLGYENIQNDFLMGLLGSVNPQRIALFLLLAGGIALLPVFITLYLGREKNTRDQLDRLFLQYCLRLEKIGLPRQSGEGPRDYAQRISLQAPNLGGQVESLTRLYESARYAEQQEAEIKELKAALKVFKPSRKDLFKRN